MHPLKYTHTHTYLPFSRLSVCLRPQTSGSSSLASRQTRASMTSSLSHARPRRPPIRGTRTSELRRCVRPEALQKGCRACSSKRLFGGGP